MPSVEEVLELLEQRGNSQYGREAVTQRQHALQAAALAEAEHAAPPLVAAALLHDVGHLLHDLDDEAPDLGIDDHHETSAYRWLQSRFPPAVIEPVRLHVAAKRYLCTVDTDYFRTLSQPSVVSLALQGGIMSPEEAEQFAANPYAEDALRLRRWDDAAKDPGVEPPPLAHFADVLRQVALAEPRA